MCLQDSSSLVEIERHGSTLFQASAGARARKENLRVLALSTKQVGYFD